MSYKNKIEEEAKDCILYYLDELTECVYNEENISDNFYYKVEEYVFMYSFTYNAKEAFSLLEELEGNYNKYDFDTCIIREPLAYLIECANIVYSNQVKWKVQCYIKVIKDYAWDNFFYDFFSEAINNCYYLSDNEKEWLIESIKEKTVYLSDYIEDLQDEIAKEDYYFNEDDFIPTEEEVMAALEEKIRELINEC